MVRRGLLAEADNEDQGCKEGEMLIEEVKKVLILGAGTMGHQIGFLCAANGFEVVFCDVGPEALEQGLGRARKLAGYFSRRGRLTAQEAAEAMSRISLSDNMEEAARDVDLVSESIPEDPELKGRVFGQLNAFCPARTVFTTNTSTLVPSMFAEATGRPDRFAAFHFHDVRLTNVVDIMPHPGTSSETLGLLNEFCKMIGQIPIVLKKENPGYVFNSMLSEWFRSAQNLASKNVASVEDIDRAWMGVMQSPIGPFGVMDTVGLDTVWKITDYWAQKLQDRQAMRNADFMKSYVDQGRLGVKVGRGFYDYPDPAFKRPGFASEKTEWDIGD